MKVPFTASDALAMTEVWEEKAIINIFNAIREAANSGMTSVTILDKMSNHMLSLITEAGFRVEFDLSGGDNCSYKITWERQ